MAKKAESSNLSKAIRDSFDRNRDARPKQIAEELTKSGFDVKQSYVSVILSQYRKKLGLKKRRRGRPAKGGVATATANAAPKVAEKKVVVKAGKKMHGSAGQGSVNMDDLRLVKELISRTGSPERARDAVNAYIDLMV